MLLQLRATGANGHVALYCGESLGRPETVREGLVEGHQVQGILLDTGCTRTLVQQDLVPPGKMTVGRVSIRCAHGDVVSYALAKVSMRIEGRRIQVQAGGAPNLPVPVLLGTDVPELAMHCNTKVPARQRSR